MNDKPRRRGRPAKENKKVSKHRIMLRPDLWSTIEAEAARRNCTVNQLVETVLQDRLVAEV